MFAFVSITVANAQVEITTNLTTDSIKVLTAEDIVNARPDAKKMKRTEKVRLIAATEDSMRLAQDSIANADFALERDTWKAQKSATIDSITTSYYTAVDSMTSFEDAKRRAEEKIFSKADIPTSKYGVVRAINENYFDKYQKMLEDDMQSAVHSAAAYAELRTERELKIKTAVGKKKSKKLDKAWKSYLKDNPEAARFWVFSGSMMETTALKK